ncbi:MAG: hypothetical protein ACFCA4_05015 [Cyanophyceae cyanobacterium]|mgnify:CR=1 FL=1
MLFWSKTEWRSHLMAIYQWSFIPEEQPPEAQKGDRRFWIVLLGAIAVGLVLSACALTAAFAEPHSIQDDARQHVFWMARFMNPGAFPNDPIADYFQTVAPWAYQGIYRLAATVGINPLFLSKLLPVALGLVAAVYSVLLGWLMMPVPVATALGAVFLQVNLWLRDDLVSGTAVAFAVPLMLAALVHGFRNQRLPLAIALLLLTGTYPQCALVILGTLTLGALPDWWMMKRSQRMTRITVALAWAVVVVGLLPFVLRDNPFGPVMGAAEAQTLGTFAPKAWSSFFTNDSWNFWVCGQRSGIFPQEWCRLMSNHSVLLVPIWAISSLFLLLVIAFRKLFPLGIYLQPASRLMGQLLLSSLILFSLAHQFLFHLHLPNRYTEHSLRIITALAGGIAIAIILDRCIRNLFNPENDSMKSKFGGLLGAGIILSLLLYPMALNAKNYDFPTTNYTAGNSSLHRFLREQSEPILVASLEKEADNIPALAQRSIYVGAKGYILPYHKGFYKVMVSRLGELTAAQYSEDWNKISQFLKETNISHWLINRDSFSETYLDSRQFRQFNLGESIRQDFQQGLQPVLPTVLDRCSVWEDSDLVLIASSCVLQAGSSQ